MLLIAGAPAAVHGQCGPGGCPIRPPSYGTRPARPNYLPGVPGGEYVQPPGSACRLYIHVGSRIRVIGTGTLVSRGSDWGAVLTCAHLFDEGASAVVAKFPSGRTYRGQLAARDRTYDLAIVKITPRPQEPLARIATDHPMAGEKLTFGGYGQDGRWRQVTGVCRGYAHIDGQSGHQTLVIAGRARDGDSGGPIWNAQGELVGVLWGTNGMESTGTYNGTLCRFTLSDRYLFPWNADLANQKDARRFAAQQQHQQQQRQSTPPTTKDPALQEIRETLQQLRGQIAGLKPADTGPILKAVQALIQRIDGLKERETDKRILQLLESLRGEAVGAVQGLAKDLPNVVQQMAVDASGQTAAEPFTNWLMLLLAGLGISVPPSLMAIVSAVLVWRLRRRLEQIAESRGIGGPAGAPLTQANQQQRQAAQPRTVVIHEQTPPPPQTVRREREFVEVEKPNGQLEALHWAMGEYVRRYPGARGIIETIEALASQYESGLTDRR